MVLVAIVAMLALALCGAPVYLIFGGLSVWLFSLLPDTPLSSAANDMFSAKFADSPLLVTIPLFTFAGVALASSKAPERLVSVSRALFGWIPGGLAIVCLMASAVFTTFTGGSGVTIVAIGALLYPALVAERYNERFSLGLVTTGGSLGVLFPPSVPVILYGVVSGLDIEGLFTAALVPGILVVLALSVYGAIVGTRAGVPRTPFDAQVALKALWYAKWEALLPPVLVGGLATGVLRIHESAAFTALYVLVVEVFVYKDIKLKQLPKIINECVVLVGAILVILAMAVGFTAYLVQANVPQLLLEWMQTFIGSKWTFLLVINVFLLIVGMLMEIFSAVVVVPPLIAPIGVHFGIDPYHLAAIFLLNLEIAYLAPPLGLNLFISSFRFEKPLPVIYRAVIPFVVLLFATLMLVSYVPKLSIWSSRLSAPINLEAEAAKAAKAERANAPGASSAGVPADSDAGAPAPAASEAPSGGETLEDLLGEPKPAAEPKKDEPPVEKKDGEQTLDDLLREP
ncbi:MAG TPA: TRAP transporter large permease [Polyangiaceae bacterium]